MESQRCMCRRSARSRGPSRSSRPSRCRRKLVPESDVKRWEEARVNRLQDCTSRSHYRTTNASARWHASSGRRFRTYCTLKRICSCCHSPEACGSLRTCSSRHWRIPECTRPRRNILPDSREGCTLPSVLTIGWPDGSQPESHEQEPSSPACHGSCMGVRQPPGARPSSPLHREDGGLGRPPCDAPTLGMLATSRPS